MFVLTMTACTKAQSPAGSAPPPPIVSAAIAPVPSASVGIAPGPAGCRVGTIATLDDHKDNHEKLENLRVLAGGDTTIITYERQSDYEMGDSWRAPFVAMRKGAGAFERTSLHVEAYACATSGLVAPNTLADPVVAWGVANTHGFQIWPGLPKTEKAQSKQLVDTTRHEVMTFAASHGVAISVTADIQCEAFCVCGDTGAKHGIWIHGLDTAYPVAESVFSSPYSAKAPDVPAIAMADHRGVFAYRDSGALWVGFLGVHGKPSGKPVKLDTGGVGAPALAMMGEDAAVAVWAKRASNDAPYKLVWARLEEGKPFTPSAMPMTTETGFAPAVIADANAMIVAWMDGDGAKKGAIHLARHAFSDPTWPSTRISPESESNARDPELSGTMGHPVLAYALFDAPRQGGTVRIAESSCE